MPPSPAGPAVTRIPATRGPKTPPARTGGPARCRPRAAASPRPSASSPSRRGRRRAAPGPPGRPPPSSASFRCAFASCWTLFSIPSCGSRVGGGSQAVDVRQAELARERAREAVDEARPADRWHGRDPLGPRLRMPAVADRLRRADDELAIEPAVHLPAPLDVPSPARVAVDAQRHAELVRRVDLALQARHRVGDPLLARLDRPQVAPQERRPRPRPGRGRPRATAAGPGRWRTGRTARRPDRPAAGPGTPSGSRS